MLLNCGPGESPLESTEIKPVNPKGNQPWIFIGKIDSEDEAPGLWPPHLKRDSLGKTLMLGGTGGRRRRGDRGWDGWMASWTRWMWVWVNSGSWWWTGRPGVLRFMGSQSRTRLSDWTELSWTFSSVGSQECITTFHHICVHVCALYCIFYCKIFYYLRNSSKHFLLIMATIIIIFYHCLTTTLVALGKY